MSLLNRMLQDLDARQGTGRPVVRLHEDVRPLSPPRPSRRPAILAAILFGLGGASAAAYFFLSTASQPVPVPVASVPVTKMAPPVDVPVVVVDKAAEKTEDKAPEKMAGPVPPKAAEKTPEKASPGAPRVASVTPPSGMKKMPAKVAGLEPAATAAPSRKGPEGDTPRRAEAPLPATDAPRHAKPPTIEKTDTVGSARERAESEYRKTLGVINQGRGPEGISGLQMVLRLDGTHIGARQLLVRLLLEARQGDEAMRTLQEGVLLVPAQSAWAMTLARLQVERDDLAGAAKTLERSLPAGAGSADYQGFAGHVLYRLGRHREALDHYLVATRLAPADGRWWLGLGLAYDGDGRVSEAREAFLRARASGTLSPELLTVVDQRLR